MATHDDSVSLRQMLDHPREAIALIQGLSRAGLDTDRVLSLALVRLAEIIGEAANRVSNARRQQHPGIPWTEIIALRNRLIHGYDTVDFDILWQVLTADLPPLIAQLEKIVPPKEPSA